MSDKPWTPTPKQKRFIEEYPIDFNATAASIRAGYSKKSASSIGYENLRKPEIQAAIKAHIEKIANKADITVERILKELARIGFSDPRDLFDEDGGLLPVDQWSDEVAASVSSMKFVNGKLMIEVKRWDKLKGLEMMGRHLAMFTDNINVPTPITVIERRIIDPTEKK